MRAAHSHLSVYLQRIESLLSRSDYLCGDAPSIADFSVYHCLWFLNTLAPETLAPYEVATRFVARMDAIPEVTPELLPSSEALEICRRAGHREGPVSGQFASIAPAPNSSTPGSARELGIGQRVVVRALDYGRDPVEGEFVSATAHDLAIRREDPRADGDRALPTRGIRGADTVTERLSRAALVACALLPSAACALITPNATPPATKQPPPAVPAPRQHCRSARSSEHQRFGDGVFPLTGPTRARRPKQRRTPPRP